MSYENIKIFGTGHWSTKGDIDSEMWSWNLDIDGKEIPPENSLYIRTNEAANFLRDLKPHLPDDYEDRMISPTGAPGGFWSLQLSLDDFRDPSKVYALLGQYFPRDVRE